MAFSIYHVQIRPLTSIDSAIDTVTIPALPQYQVYIASISQQGENTSSQKAANRNRVGRSYIALKKNLRFFK